MKITKYIVATKDGDSYILLNPATSGIIRVNADAYKRIMARDLAKFSPEEKEILKKASFLVSDDYDDTILTNIYKAYLDNGLNIVFITSEDCNFNCSYCYEHHKKKHIEKEIYDAALKYAKRSDKTDIVINWFGGEPLLEISNIEYFMNKLIALDKFKKVTSSVITNGYLLDKTNFLRLLKVKTNIFQITLDGLKSEHDSLRFLRNGEGTFDKIVSNIKQMAETSLDFKVYLRCNFNEGTNLLDYVDFIYDLIGNDKRFILDFEAIGNWESSSEGVPSAHSNGNVLKAMQKAYHKGLRVRCVEEDTCPSGYFCVAKKKDSFILNYKGDVLKCTVKLDWDKNIVGHLNNDGTIDYNKNLLLWREPTRTDNCDKCNVRPLCLQRYCPHIDYTTCKKQKEMAAISAMKVKYGHMEN